MRSDPSGQQERLWTNCPLVGATEGGAKAAAPHTSPEQPGAASLLGAWGRGTRTPDLSHLVRKI